MSQITVLTGPERRRRWRPEDKLRILAEAFSPGGCVGAVARRHDVSRGLIYTWRRQLRRELPQPAPAFAQAVLAQETPPAPAPCAAIRAALPAGCLGNTAAPA